MSLTSALSNPDEIDRQTASEQPACPKCGRNAVVQLIKGMRRYGVTNDWFRCDKCEHLFTNPRVS